MKTATVEAALEDLVAACAKAYGERMRDHLRYVVDGIRGPAVTSYSPGVLARGHEIRKQIAVEPVRTADVSTNGAAPARKPKRGKWAPGSPGRVPAWYKAQQRKAGRK